MWGFTGISFVLICISVIEVTIVIVYLMLCNENYEWYYPKYLQLIGQVLAILRCRRLIKPVHLRLFNMVHAIPFKNHRLCPTNCISILLSIGMFSTRYDMRNFGIFGCIYFCLAYLWVFTFHPQLMVDL
jgi:hypothetical protein